MFSKQRKMNAPAALRNFFNQSSNSSNDFASFSGFDNSGGFAGRKDVGLYSQRNSQPFKKTEEDRNWFAGINSTPLTENGDDFNLFAGTNTLPLKKNKDDSVWVSETNSMSFQDKGNAWGEEYNSVGSITKLNDVYGLINDEILFVPRVYKGPRPFVGDRVTFESTASPNSFMKWTASRVQMIIEPEKRGNLGNNSARSQSFQSQFNNDGRMQNDESNTYKPNVFLQDERVFNQMVEVKPPKTIEQNSSTGSNGRGPYTKSQNRKFIETYLFKAEQRQNRNREKKREQIYNNKLSEICCIIDRNDLDGSISEENWSSIENKLVEAYKQVIGDNTADVSLDFCDEGWFNFENKLISFKSEGAVENYRKALIKIGEPWPGAKLDIISKKDIIRRPRVKTFVPAEPSEPNEILEIIEMSNPEFNINDWKIRKVFEEKAHAREVILSVSTSTANILKNHNKINYGFGAIIPKIDDYSKSTNKATA